MFCRPKLCTCKFFSHGGNPDPSPMETLDLFGFETRPRLRAKRTSGAPIKNRLKAYLIAIFAKGTRWFTVNFDRLAKSFQCSRRAVEMAVSSIRQSARFIFETVRVGRSFCVRVSDRNPHPSTGVFASQKRIQNNTARRPAQNFEKFSEAGTARTPGGWEKKPTPTKILRLAAWIARHELGKIHRAASRTLFRTQHAANFCAEALHAGHGRADVVSSYEYALRSIDSELAHLPPAVRWEPSSLVKLAKRRLADGMETGKRVAMRWRFLNRPAPVESVEPAPIVPRGTHAPENSALRRFNLGRALMEAVRHFGDAAPIVQEIRAELAALPQS